MGSLELGEVEPFFLHRLPHRRDVLVPLDGGLDRLFQAHGVPLALRGLWPCPQFVPLPGAPADLLPRFMRAACRHGVTLYTVPYVNFSHRDADVAEALELLVDPSFVAIVPLGGRHVNHFWRLLHGLGIPYATLLDLDLGRDGGGYGRVKNALQQLLALGTPREKILTLSDGTLLSDKRLAGMGAWDQANLQGWLDYLESSSSVFFSAPLDLDLAMLAAFPAAYAATIEGTGPRMTNEAAAEVVLGTAGSGLASYAGSFQPYREHLAAYRYHFLTHSKPATHLRALAHLDLPALKAGMPPVLQRVLQHIELQLSGLF